MKRIAIIGRPRSGTTALRVGWRKLKNIHVYDEIFHEVDANREENFLNFVDALSATPNAHLLTPSYKVRNTLFNAYVEHLDACTAKAAPEAQAYVCSINYNFLGALNCVTQSFEEPPRLLNYLGVHKFLIIHLVRRNLLASIISEMLAKQTGVWHLGYLSADKASQDSVRVDVDYLLRRLYLGHAELLTYAAQLQTQKSVLSVDYERLYLEDRRLDETEMARIEEFLGLNNLPRVVGLAKTRVRKLRETIENIREVETALRWTQFHSMLDE